MEINLIIIFIMLIMCISMFAYTISRYKKCPPGKILVIYGQTGGFPKYITNGGIFILPIIQNYTYLDLAPMAIDIVLKDALSLDNTRIDISFMVTIAISNEPGVIDNAIERILGQTQEAIQSMAKDIILGQSRLIIAQNNPNDLKKNLDKFISSLSQHIDCQLKKLGLKLINININSIIDENGKRSI